MTLFKLHMLHRLWRYRFKSEVPSIAFLRSLDLRGKTLVDVGANRGVYSIEMSRAAGPAGRVFAFEPQPELGPHLERVKKEFRLDNLTLENRGLSAAPRRAEMRRKSAGSGGASVEQWAHQQDEDRIDVELITLDDYLRERDADPVAFIKCDVEGHELDVFRGARRVLERDLPMLLFEAHEGQPGGEELFTYLVDLGYEGYFFQVEPDDHASLWRKGRSRLVPWQERNAHPYPAPGIRHRNYLFARAGALAA